MQEQLQSMPKNNDELYTMLMRKDEITWKAILTELVRSEHMDPWDIDVSKLSKRFIEALKKLQQLDVHVSGKVVLAAALLLKIKSTRLIGADIDRLDALFSTSEDEVWDDGFMSEFGDGFEGHYIGKAKLPKYGLIPRTPQPRKRKVSIYDLMDALQQAMEVKRRRTARQLPEKIKIMLPGKKVDITQVIREVFTKIKVFFAKENGQLFFSDLVGEDPTKEDKIYTFIPLLHLTNQRKIDLGQDESFGPIEIRKSR